MKRLLYLLAALPWMGCDKDTDPPVTPVLPALSVQAVTVSEGNANQTIQVEVRLDKAATSPVVVNYSTLSGTAQPVADFVSIANAQLTFAAGEQQKNIAVQVIGDDIKEQDETFEILLLNPVNATLATPRATITLLNDDTDNELVIPASGYLTPETYPGRTLVWQDEFNGTSLNTTFWTHEIGTGSGGWGNNELQYYRPENTYFTEGKLIIEAREENFNGANYTSSRIITKDKKSFQYGRIDIRAALPKGKGVWPALWMLGSNLTQAGWPACGEIDIMELIGSDPGRVHGTVHYGGSTALHQSNTASYGLTGNAQFYDAFHVFSLEWEENRLRWYVDDVLFHEMTPAQLKAGQPWPFNQQAFFIFNVAVGGNWPGSPDATTVFPQRMIVDYVRVFQ